MRAVLRHLQLDAAFKALVLLLGHTASGSLGHLTLASHLTFTTSKKCLGNLAALKHADLFDVAKVRAFLSSAVAQTKLSKKALEEGPHYLKSLTKGDMNRLNEGAFSVVPAAAPLEGIAAHPCPVCARKARAIIVPNGSGLSCYEVPVAPFGPAANAYLSSGGLLTCASGVPIDTPLEYNGLGSFAAASLRRISALAALLFVYALDDPLTPHDARLSLRVRLLAFSGIADATVRKIDLELVASVQALTMSPTVVYEVIARQKELPSPDSQAGANIRDMCTFFTATREIFHLNFIEARRSKFRQSPPYLSFANGLVARAGYEDMDGASFTTVNLRTGSLSRPFGVQNPKARAFEEAQHHFIDNMVKGVSATIARFSLVLKECVREHIRVHDDRLPLGFFSDGNLSRIALAGVNPAPGTLSRPLSAASDPILDRIVRLPDFVTMAKSCARVTGDSNPVAYGVQSFRESLVLSVKQTFFLALADWVRYLASQNEQLAVLSLKEFKNAVHAIVCKIRRVVCHTILPAGDGVTGIIDHVRQFIGDDGAAIMDDGWLATQLGDELNRGARVFVVFHKICAENNQARKDAIARGWIQQSKDKVPSDISGGAAPSFSDVAVDGDGDNEHDEDAENIEEDAPLLEEAKRKAGKPTAIQLFSIPRLRTAIPSCRVDRRYVTIDKSAIEAFCNQFGVPVDLASLFLLEARPFARTSTVVTNGVEVHVTYKRPGDNPKLLARVARGTPPPKHVKLAYNNLLREPDEVVSAEELAGLGIQGLTSYIKAVMAASPEGSSDSAVLSAAVVIFQGRNKKDKAGNPLALLTLATALTAFTVITVGDLTHEAHEKLYIGIPVPNVDVAIAQLPAFASTTSTTAKKLAHGRNLYTAVMQHAPEHDAVLTDLLAAVSEALGSPFSEALSDAALASLGYAARGAGAAAPEAPPPPRQQEPRSRRVRQRNAAANASGGTGVPDRQLKRLCLSDLAALATRLLPELSEADRVRLAAFPKRVDAVTFIRERFGIAAITVSQLLPAERVKLGYALDLVPDARPPEWVLATDDEYEYWGCDPGVLNLGMFAKAVTNKLTGKIDVTSAKLTLSNYRAASGMKEQREKVKRWNAHPQVAAAHAALGAVVRKSVLEEDAVAYRGVVATHFGVMLANRFRTCWSAERYRFRTASTKVMQDFLREKVYIKGGKKVCVFWGAAKFASPGPTARFIRIANGVAYQHGSPEIMLTDEFASSLGHWYCGSQLAEAVERRPGHQRRRTQVRDAREAEAAAGGDPPKWGAGAKGRGCCDAVRGLRHCSHAGCHIFVDRDVNGALNIMRKGRESKRLPDGSFVDGPAHLQRKGHVKRPRTFFVLSGAPGCT